MCLHVHDMALQHNNPPPLGLIHLVTNKKPITHSTVSLKNLQTIMIYVVGLIIAACSVKLLFSLVSHRGPCAQLQFSGDVSIHRPVRNCSTGAGFARTVVSCSVCTLASSNSAICYLSTFSVINAAKIARELHGHL